jgi:hypothetical protein
MSLQTKSQVTDSLVGHPLFKPFVDPVSGVTSHLLSEVVAPVQQSFYYVNPSLSADERLLWLMVAWPPSRARTLAVVSRDPANPFVRHFPQTQFPTAHPRVAPDGGVWFGSGPTIFRMDCAGNTRRIFTLSDDIIAGRELKRLATHLSLSADGKFFLLDGAIGDTWFVGTAELDSGKFHLIREFDAQHNHAQFSPVDPGLFMVARDHYTDPVTGKFHHHTQRSFLMDTDGDRHQCINPQFPCSPFHGACHEWWSQDGRLCYIDYDTGAYEYDPATGATVHAWKEPLCHAHCSRDRRFWCADESPYKWQKQPCKVLLFDRQTCRRTEIQSAMPMPGGDYWGTRSIYHIDPHPQFSPRDSYVVYTATNDHGRPTVALAPLNRIPAS